MKFFTELAAFVSIVALLVAIIATIAAFCAWLTTPEQIARPVPAAEAPGFDLTLTTADGRKWVAKWEEAR